MFLCRSNQESLFGQKEKDFSTWTPRLEDGHVKYAPSNGYFYRSFCRNCSMYCGFVKWLDHKITFFGLFLPRRLLSSWSRSSSHTRSAACFKKEKINLVNIIALEAVDLASFQFECFGESIGHYVEFSPDFEKVLLLSTQTMVGHIVDNLRRRVPAAEMHLYFGRKLNRNENHVTDMDPESVGLTKWLTSSPPMWMVSSGGNSVCKCW